MVCLCTVLEKSILAPYETHRPVCLVRIGIWNGQLLDTGYIYIFALTLMAVDRIQTVYFPGITVNHFLYASCVLVCYSIEVHELLIYSCNNIKMQGITSNAGSEVQSSELLRSSARSKTGVRNCWLSLFQMFTTLLC